MLTVLSPAQRRAHRLAAALYAALAVSGVLLAVPGAGGLFVLVAHLALGALFAVVLGVFVWRHRISADARDGAATRLGNGLAALAVVGVLSGLVMTVAGAPRALPGLRWLHVAASLLLLAPWVLHALRRDRLVRARPLAIVSGLAALALGAVLVPTWWRGTPLPVADAFRDLPRPALLGPAEALVGAGACAECHADIARQWEDSSHHYSSMNNPWHRRVVAHLASTRGAKEAAECATCHSPAAFLAGRADELDPESPLGGAGINCVTCHATVHAAPGAARYVVDGTLAAGPDPRAWYWLRAYPEAHRQAMRKPLHGDAVFCASCHGGRLHEPSTYDEWRASPYSGEAPDALRGAAPASCVDCHMPRVASTDPAAVGEKARSHRFAAANTWNAEYHGLDEQRLETERFLRDRITLSVLSITPRGELTVLVANRGVGHHFPTGSVDLHDVWLEVTVRDARGRRLLHSTAHRYGTLLLDAAGKPIEKHDLWNARRMVYERRIPAGGVDVARFRVPRSDGPVQVTARLRMRKFTPGFHAFSFPDVVTPLSTVTVAEVKGPTPASPDTLLDWGIGLLLEGRAAEARRVLEGAPDSVDGYLAHSRACRASGDIAGAVAAAEKAMALAPADPRGKHARDGTAPRASPSPALPPPDAEWLKAHPREALESRPGHVHQE